LALPAVGAIESGSFADMPGTIASASPTAPTFNALTAAAVVCTSITSGLVEPAGRTPMDLGSTVILPSFVERASFSCAAACCRISRNFWFSVASASGSAERMSKSIHTSRGIAFTEVPPPVTLAE